MLGHRDKGEEAKPSFDSFLFNIFAVKAMTPFMLIFYSIFQQQNEEIFFSIFNI